MVGSIPACAGEPWRLSTRTERSPVYPRVCGGTRDGRSKSEGKMGLSPRVRGNRRRASPSAPPPRSIPACAGEPLNFRRPVTLDRVYPRVCGGTAAPRSHRRCRAGLSPRVRGNRRLSESSPPGRGSIPACAGEPRAPTDGPRSSLVYPRVCGGTLLAEWRVRESEGLSPRVRGNLHLHPPVVVRGRSIPACAGEPPECRHCMGPGAVYPRVCGGT